jgi:hypothetical protein
MQRMLKKDLKYLVGRASNNDEYDSDAPVYVAMEVNQELVDLLERYVSATQAAKDQEYAVCKVLFDVTGDLCDISTSRWVELSDELEAAFKAADTSPEGGWGDWIVVANLDACKDVERIERERIVVWADGDIQFTCTCNDATECFTQVIDTHVIETMMNEFPTSEKEQA